MIHEPIQSAAALFVDVYEWACAKYGKAVAILCAEVQKARAAWRQAREVFE